jgi:hypothetical protein
MKLWNQVLTSSFERTLRDSRFDCDRSILQDFKGRVMVPQQSLREALAIPSNPGLGSKYLATK